jgi:hypothetical protein
VTCQLKLPLAVATAAYIRPMTGLWSTAAAISFMIVLDVFFIIETTSDAVTRWISTTVHVETVACAGWILVRLEAGRMVIQ